MSDVIVRSPGPRGQGVPTGGTTGQALVKNSNADFDVTWADQTGGSGDTSKSKAVTAVTSNLTLNDAHHVILADATSGQFTISLPAAAGFDRKVFVIKKTDASANAVVIDPNGAETIDGLATIQLDAQFQAVALVCNGTSWSIV